MKVPIVTNSSQRTKREKVPIGRISFAIPVIPTEAKRSGGTCCFQFHIQPATQPASEVMINKGFISKLL